MATTKSTDVEEYNEEGFAVDDDADVTTTDFEPGDEIPETVTATDPAGNPVEIGLTDAHRSDLTYETAIPEEVVDDRDWEGKEEDAELARQQHELGIDNQLLDPNEDRDV